MDADSQTDADLVASIGAGEREALSVLYRRHAPWLLLRLSRRCADPGLVDEVVQDTFMAVWQGASRYRGQGEVGGWIWGIAIRRLIDQFRRQRPATLGLTDVQEVEPSTEERVLLGIEYGDLGKALRLLPPDLRAVVQVTVLDGLTTREAGDLLGIPAGTVKTRMMRARAFLRKELV
jgi:RNA polymerase sigma-70 factor, ECF subfamily